MNKDFYDNLPGVVCEILDKLIEDYGNKDWFEKAWEEYRQHVLNTDMFEIRMPGVVFGKYVNQDLTLEEADILHNEMDINVIVDGDAGIFTLEAKEEE